MDQTTNLSLPFIMPSQAQKQVTHNEALQILDVLVQLAVLTRSLSSPPSSPADGACYIIATGGSGTWSGKDASVAAWQDGAWHFFTPLPGWRAWVVDEAALLVWTDTTWVAAETTIDQLQNLTRLGVGTTADATNPFSAKLDTALWSAKYSGEGGTGDLRYTMNKEASGNTLSLLLQDNWSGRAEIGLTGDDDLHFKVSPDGANWNDALVVAAASGRVSFPRGATGLREQLTANRTYHVRADGNDANDGLSDSAGGAFLTIQKAIDTAVALDLATYAVTINVGAGTYAESVALKSYLGAGPITLTGDTETPTNVVIAPASGYAVTADTVSGQWQVYGFELGGTSGCLYANGGSALTIDHLAFNGSGSQVYVRAGARVDCANATFEILNAACTQHAYTNLPGSSFAPYHASYTLPAGGLHCSDAFAVSLRASMTNFGACTFANAGTVTGKKYRAEENGIVSTLAGGDDFLPGDTAGTTATGGQYT